MKNIISYRLFNIGNTVFFQVLSQDKSITTSSESPKECIEYKNEYSNTEIIVGSDEYPEISELGKNRYFILLRGMHTGMSMEPCMMKLESYDKCREFIDHFGLAVREFILRRVSGTELGKELKYSVDDEIKTFYTI